MVNLMAEHWCVWKFFIYSEICLISHAWGREILSQNRQGVRICSLKHKEIKLEWKSMSHNTLIDRLDSVFHTQWNGLHGWWIRQVLLYMYPPHKNICVNMCQIWQIFLYVYINIYTHKRVYLYSWHHWLPVV